MTAFTVAVSAGHNPEAKGAKTRDPVDRNKFIAEYDETTVWQAELIKQLEGLKTDPNLYLQPKFVQTGGLKAKVEEINAMKPDLAIEIHFNAGAKTGGCETLYAPNSVTGLKWAKVIHTAMAIAMANKNRGVKEGWYKMDRPGIVDYDGDVDGDEKPDYFLMKTQCVALILEPEFMYKIDNIRKKPLITCVAIANAVLQIADQKHVQWNLPPQESSNA